MYVHCGTDAGVARAAVVWPGPRSRPGEPNLFLIVTYKNFAAMDRPLADGEKNVSAVFGSLDQAHEAGMKRAALRENKGAMLLQTLEFTN